MTRQCLVHSLGGNAGVDLLAVSVVTNSRGRSSDLSSLCGSNTDNLSVNSARNTVVDLDVQLGESVLLVNRSLGDISDGSRLDHVADGESLDGLVLRDHTGAVRTSDAANVSSSLLVASVGSSLLRHGCVTVETLGLRRLNV